MNCPVCEKHMIGIEYAYDSPYHYDGVSEWFCEKDNIRIGRWSNKHLGEGDLEKVFGGER